MELILISENKLKVMLNSGDMERFEINAEQMDYDNTSTRRALWSILDEAQRATGFDAAANRVMIQAYPSRGGGCELYVTRIANRADGAFSRADGVRATPRVKKSSLCEIYRFESQEDMLRVCRALCAAGFSGESVSYYDDDFYYLALEPQACAAVANEFGARLRSKQINLYIAEHCRKICEKAVEKLAPICADG